MVYWLENKPQCNSWGFSFLFKQENILNMSSNYYKEVLCHRLVSLGVLGDVLTELSQSSRISKETICAVIERRIDALQDAFEDYKNAPTSDEIKDN